MQFVLTYVKLELVLIIFEQFKSCLLKNAYFYEQWFITTFIFNKIFLKCTIQNSDLPKIVTYSTPLGNQYFFLLPCSIIRFNTFLNILIVLFIIIRYVSIIKKLYSEKIKTISPITKDIVFFFLIFTIIYLLLFFKTYYDYNESKRNFSSYFKFLK